MGSSNRQFEISKHNDNTSNESAESVMLEEEEEATVIICDNPSAPPITDPSWACLPIVPPYHEGYDMHHVVHSTQVMDGSSALWNTSSLFVSSDGSRTVICKGQVLDAQ